MVFELRLFFIIRNINEFIKMILGNLTNICSIYILLFKAELSARSSLTLNKEKRDAEAKCARAVEWRPPD